jgi:hypothetical protein
MAYKILTQDEQDEIVVAFMQSQERDAFTHQINLDRFDAMLPSLPEGNWKSRISELRAETAQRLAEVQSIIAATEDTLPSQERIDAAIARLAAKASPPST